MLNPVGNHGGARWFHTTRWSLIAGAASLTTEHRTALDELCKIYWPPVYTFIRRQHAYQDALDLTQGFFAHILKRNDLTTVNRQRGRFRTWLLAAVKHFVANEWHHTHAQKRGGEVVVVSVEALDAEEREMYPSEAATPE